MTMAEKIRNGLQMAMLVLGVLTGSSSLGILVWKGGALVNDHEQLKLRVAVIEANGSRNVGEHIKVDDLREKLTNDRLTKLETIADLIPELSQKIAVMNYKLDDIKTSVDDHKKQTEQKKTP